MAEFRQLFLHKETYKYLMLKKENFINNRILIVKKVIK